MTTEIKKRETTIDPWSDLDRAFGEMQDHFFDAFGLQPFGFAGENSPTVFRAARTDITDRGSSYRIVAEVPGIPKEKLDIRVRGSSVEIRGEHAEDVERKDDEWVHRERSYAGYYRALELPEPVVATEAKAKVENGLLELELPKRHPKPTEDEVKVPVP
ncbi:MAG TPA: Hsp20/alpha crystallin family protein [Thermoplasmata archaeon]|nr:Hsp20/alpha crystallin family protein [Thermoplasmata archaeon]